MSTTWHCASHHTRARTSSKRLPKQENVEAVLDLVRGEQLLRRVPRHDGLRLGLDAIPFCMHAVVGRNLFQRGTARRYLLLHDLLPCTPQNIREVDTVAGVRGQVQRFWCRRQVSIAAAPTHRHRRSLTDERVHNLEGNTDTVEAERRLQREE